MGVPVPLAPTPYIGVCDPNHSHEAWVADYDGGKMDGFGTTPADCEGITPPPDYPYAYLPYAEVRPYFDAGKEFSIADRMFASQTGPSYPDYNNGLGFRVPLIVISKYAKRGYVSHVQHEFGSILKFCEESSTSRRSALPICAPTICPTRSTSRSGTRRSHRSRSNRFS